MSRFGLFMILIWILFASSSIFAMDGARDGVLLSDDGTELGTAMIRRWDIGPSGGISGATVEWVAWADSRYDITVALRDRDRSLIGRGLAQTEEMKHGTYNTVVPLLGSPVDASLIEYSAVSVRATSEQTSG